MHSKNPKSFPHPGLTQATDPLPGSFPHPRLAPVNSTAGRRKGRAAGCANTSQARGPGRSGTEMGTGAARPGANTAIDVRQEKITNPDPDG